MQGDVWLSGDVLAGSLARERGLEQRGGDFRGELVQVAKGLRGGHG